MLSILSIIIPVVVVVATLGLIIRFFTGDKILVLTFRSAFYRLLAGIIISLFPLLWWRLKLNEIFEPGPLGTAIVVYFLFACSTSAIVLIPLSAVQFLGVLVNTSKGKKSADEIFETDESAGFFLEEKNKCPNCESKRLRKKSTYNTFLIFIALFIAMIIFAWISIRYHWDVLFMLTYISSPFVFGSIILSGFSATFGKSICLDCKHRWR